MLAQLSALDLQVFKDAGVCAKNYFQPYFSQPVALFKSYSREIDTSKLIKNFESVLLPESDPESYAQKILAADVKLLIVPGLAFDLAGNRLGRGGGYYDRCVAILRSSHKCPRITGLCLKQQILSFIPVESHDQKMDQIVSL
jgi:5-formyltetrahydrofolate cyclo-ligase